MTIEIKLKFYSYILTIFTLLLVPGITMAATVQDSATEIKTEAQQKWTELLANEGLADQNCTCMNKTLKKGACVTIRIAKAKKTTEATQNAECADFGSNTDFMVIDSLLVENSAYFVGTDIGSIGYINSGNLVIGERFKKFDSCSSGGKTLDDCKNGIAAILSQLGIESKAPAALAPVKPDLEITLPGLQLSTVKGPENGTLYLPWIAEYVATAFKYGITIASILAVVLIILQGIKITTSGGGEKKTEAYKTIARVVIGLIIAWSSYAILYTINPNLVKLKTLQVESVLPQLADQEIANNGTDNSVDALPTNGDSKSCITTENGKSLKTLGLKNITITASVPFVQQDMAEAIKRLDQIVEQVKIKNNRPDLRLIISSAGRLLSQQQIFWDKAQKEHPENPKKYASPPTCARGGHLTGQAIDVSIEGSNINKYWNWAGADIDDKITDGDMMLLKTIMAEAGFSRYCGEWWHYEYNLPLYPKRTKSPAAC